MLKLGVCDDDKAVCEWLRQKLRDTMGKCGGVAAGDLLLSFRKCLAGTLEENQFDIIFLDIQLEKSNGIQIGEEDSQKKHGRTIRITYISTFREYAMQLFHIHPFDFLIKPLKEEDVYHVMDECVPVQIPKDRSSSIGIRKECTGLHTGKLCIFTVRKRPSIWLQSKEKRNSGGRSVMWKREPETIS